MVLKRNYLVHFLFAMVEITCEEHVPYKVFFPLFQRSGLGILSSIPGVCKFVYLPRRIRRGVWRSCVCQSYTSEEQTSRHLAKTSSYIERKDKH